MKYSRIATLAAVSVMMLASMQASAQYRLPASHSQQHQEMLAHQHPAAAAAKIEAKKQINAAIREREAQNLDDIFSYNWDSQSVNAYQGATIPQVKDIDVSGYVSPLRRINVSSHYGWRPQFGRMHRGVDLTLHVGDSVMAAFDGKVRLVKYEAKGYGHYVVIRHDNGMETVYGHLSRTIVKPNQRVRAGQLIALGGNTGRSTGPHLHFETRYMGLAINPEQVIDFENKMPHNEIFTFSKASYEKSQHYGPARSAKATAKKVGAKKSKATASAKKQGKKKSRK